MIAWFARNSVAANLLLVAIALGGFLALKGNIALEVFPSGEPDTISVSVALRGATPEDVELGVAVRIEEAVQDLEGIERIVSRSVEGSTSVSIEVDADYDPRRLLDDVKSRVDAINTFPVDAEKPIVSLSVRKRPVIDMVISAPYSEREVREYAEKLREEVLRVDGITQVELDAVRRYEIAIEASQDALRRYGLTLNDLAQAIRGSSADLSGGNVKADGGEVLIRSKGQAYRKDDFANIVVKSSTDGTIIRIGDVATVNDGFVEEAVLTRFNGERAAIIGVSRVGTQSALEIAEKVRAFIDEKSAVLPQGFELSYWGDRSVALKSRLSILTWSAVQGGLLVIILLTLFLRPAVALWVFVGIPISFLGAFICMALFDISLNIMSAFGFLIVLGIVVDDAIVTGENVYRHLRDGDDGLIAAIEGTREVAVPVTFGVLTTIMAFLPLMFIEGRLGEIFSFIPAVVIPVLLFSLIESKFVLPAHLKNIRIIRKGDKQSWLQDKQRRFANGFEQMVLRYYQPALQRVLTYRYATLASFVGILLIIVAVFASGWVRFVFFPRVPSETATASLEMPIGTPFEVTDRHIQRILEAAQDLQEKYREPETGRTAVLNILASTGSEGGSSGSNRGRVQFEILPREERDTDITANQLIREWRQMIGQIPGAESLSLRAEWFRPGDPINIQFSGNSLESLSAVGDEVKRRLATYPGVFDISDSLSDGKEELEVELTPAGQLAGLDRSAVLSQVSQAFKGLEAQRIQRGRDDVRVLVRLPQSERQTVDTLRELQITTPDGRRIPLTNVAKLIPGKGPSQITRIDRFRVLNVTADVNKESTNMVVLQSDLTDYIDGLLLQYPEITYSAEGEARQQRESFGSLSVGLVVVLFGIYCLLALPLRSYTEPLIVMSVIPFGVIGAVFGHLITGNNFSFLSLMGLMALIGVVVNDSLVLVDYVNIQRRKGMALLEAVTTAGAARFRPVMLTSLTTFFGLTPLLLERSTSAQWLIPMAVSLAFGIIFATFITLLLVPANLVIADDIGRRLRHFGRWLKGRPGEPVSEPESAN